MTLSDPRRGGRSATSAPPCRGQESTILGGRSCREGHCSQCGMLHDVKRSVLVSRSQPLLGLHLDHQAAVRPVMHRRPLS